MSFLECQYEFHIKSLKYFNRKIFVVFDILFLQFINNSSLCRLGVMPTERECICCQELNEIKYAHLNERVEDYLTGIMYSTSTSLYLLVSYRYAAYRQFCWFIHTRLGIGVHHVIPSCVVERIRQ
ncbi:uncharacterized protein LOC130642276 [Hydractinia symbiolongicarpus]|uniref:uncharacterized protein LOC130642276 n=1 Tax=Hydractinia symbiolongicarpus TaxID=13093 RepID=UPI00254ED106|nr:uncharacterized protein LOC130642276 [Hydractinia symbiolongicarpus]